jgi:predicted nuclease of predicted toxin-antitoxin system
MLRLASDADVHGAIIRGLQRRQPALDLVRAQDALPEGTSDPEILAWAASENRVLITNDRNTMIAHASERRQRSAPMPGVIVTTNEQSIGSAISDIALIAQCMAEAEIRQQGVIFLPLRNR